MAITTIIMMMVMVMIMMRFSRWSWSSCTDGRRSAACGSPPWSCSRPSASPRSSASSRASSSSPRATWQPGEALVSRLSGSGPPRCRWATWRARGQPAIHHWLGLSSELQPLGKGEAKQSETAPSPKNLSHCLGTLVVKGRPSKAPPRDVEVVPANATTCGNDSWQQKTIFLAASFSYFLLHNIISPNPRGIPA